MHNTQLKRKESGEYVILKDGKETPVHPSQVEGFLGEACNYTGKAYLENKKLKQGVSIPSEIVEVRVDDYAEMTNGGGASLGRKDFAFLKSEVKEELMTDEQANRSDEELKNMIIGKQSQPLSHKEERKNSIRERAKRNNLFIKEYVKLSFLLSKNGFKNDFLHELISEHFKEMSSDYNITLKH